MKLSLLLLVVLTLQFQSDGAEEIMDIIQNLLDKMGENVPSTDQIDGLTDEFHTYQDTDSERHGALVEQVSAQAGGIEAVAAALEVVKEEYVANRESDIARVDSLEETCSSHGSEIEELGKSVEEAKEETAKMLVGQSALQLQVEDLKQHDSDTETNMDTLKTEIETLKAEKVLSEESLKLQIAYLDQEKEELRAELEEYKQKVIDLENSPAKESVSSYMWVISNYARNKRSREALYSPTFNSGPYGYKLQAYAYLHGRGAGARTNHLSLFFKLWRGKYDDILEWPFPHHVQFQLLPQTPGMVSTTNSTSISDKERVANLDVFGRPKTSNGNTGWGFSQFLTQEEVESKYVGNDKLYIKIRVL